MKIEIVSFTGDSGLADYAVSMSRALGKLMPVTLVTAQSLPMRFEQMGFTVLRVFRRTRHYPIDIVRFFLGVYKRRPDWILVQGPLKFPIIDALLIRVIRQFGVHAAVTVHDVLPHYPKRWSEAEFVFYYRSFSRIITHSKAASIKLKTMGVAVETLVVPHGVYDIFCLTNIGRQKARTLLGGLSATDFVVLFFGHLEPRKGLVPFLDVARSLQGNRGIKFVIAGHSSLNAHESRYQQYLEEARFLPNVILHDRRIAFEDVENYFAACDVVALPYLEGTTSGVLKLAIAFGKPVVASRVGDLVEQMPPGGGVFIDGNVDMVQQMQDALETMRWEYKVFANAIAVSKKSVQWHDIAQNIVDYLKLPPEAHK